MTSHAALEVTEVGFSYGRARALDDVSFRIEPGEIVALIGPNGAGKSTLLHVLCRTLPLREGRVLLHGQNTARYSQADAVRAGLLLVPEGRQVFWSMTVEDNLLLGMYVRRRVANAAQELRAIYDLFPRLGDRKKQLAGTLSGGEQQMLAIGRAMMGRPSVMLLNEPSLGLSPKLVGEVVTTLAKLRDDGLTMLLVEQNAQAALQLAGRGYILQAGRLVKSGTSAQLADAIRHVYLGRTVDDAAAGQ